MKNFDFRGKHIVVTGASGSLGFALVQRFVNKGARVSMMARGVEKMSELVDNHHELSKSVLIIKCDVTSVESVQTAFDEAVEKFGNVDGLVNNSGAVHINSFRHSKIEKLKNVIDVNYFGTLNVTHRALEHFVEGGFVCFISSIASLFPSHESYTYSNTKNAVAEFARCLSLELRPRGVSVTTMCPGFFESDFLKGNSTLPLTMKLDYVADKVVNGIEKRKDKELFPFFIGFLLCLFHFLFAWCPSFPHWLNRNAVRKMYLAKDARPHIDPSKELQIRDPFGFKHLFYMIPFAHKFSDLLEKALVMFGNTKKK